MLSFFAIKQLDCLGAKFDFYIGGKKLKRLKTVFGGFLTLIFLALATLALVTFSLKLADKSNPEVSVNVNVATRDHPNELFFSGFYINFGMFDGAIFPKTENTRKFFTIRAERETTYATQNGRLQEIRSTIEPFHMVKCEHVTHNYTDLTSAAFARDSGEFYRGAVFCGNLIRDKHWWIQGSKIELPYTRIRYRIYPCSLENPADCATVAELAASQFLTVIYRPAANFSNYKQPLNGGLDADLTSLFSVITKTKFIIWLRETTVLDDYIDFFRNFGPTNKSIEQEMVTSTIGTRDGSLHCTELQIEDGTCNPYIELEVRSSNTQTIVERRYYKFLTMISEVGGFGDLIFIILAFVSQFWNNYYQVKWIRKQLYSGLMENPFEVFEDESWVVEAKEDENLIMEENGGKKISSGLSRVERAGVDLYENNFEDGDKNLMKNNNKTNIFAFSPSSSKNDRDGNKEQGGGSRKSSFASHAAQAGQSGVRGSQKKISIISSNKTPKHGILGSKQGILRKQKSGSNHDANWPNNNKSNKNKKKIDKAKMEELRFEFDCLEFMDVSKKIHILNLAFLKGYHRVLLPHVLYTLQKEQKNKKSGKSHKESAKDKQKGPNPQTGFRQAQELNKSLRFGDLGSQGADNQKEAPTGSTPFPRPGVRAEGRSTTTIGIAFTKVLLQKLGKEDLFKKDPKNRSFLKGILKLGKFTKTQNKGLSGEPEAKEDRIEALGKEDEPLVLVNGFKTQNSPQEESRRIDESKKVGKSLSANPDGHKKISLTGMGGGGRKKRINAFNKNFKNLKGRGEQRRFLASKQYKQRSGKLMKSRQDLRVDQVPQRKPSERDVRRVGSSKPELNYQRNLGGRVGSSQALLDKSYSKVVDGEKEKKKFRR